MKLGVYSSLVQQQASNMEAQVGDDEGLKRHSWVASSMDLDDIPEEEPVSSKYSEEKEVRVDSGIGEWDSESSRKTSISSQGRMSPETEKSSRGGKGHWEEEVKRKSQQHEERNCGRDAGKTRRSGLNMVTGESPTITDRPVVRTALPRLPKIPRSLRASGKWSRKVSPAGMEFLKMDDEMEEVTRNGRMVLVPRKISDHIPVVAIMSTENYESNEWNENLGLDDEELQIQKKASTDRYELHRHRWEFFGKRDFRRMMLLTIDGNRWMSAQEKYEAIKSHLSEKEQKKMEKMLKQGYSYDDVVNHILEEADKKSGTKSFSRKMEELMEGKELTDEEVIELMKNQLGADSKAKMEEMLKQGHSMKDVIEKFMKTGETQEEENKATAETMKHIMKSKKKSIKMSENELVEMMKKRLDEKGINKMNEMLAKGMSVKEVLESFSNETNSEKDESEFAKKINQLTEGKEMSNYQILELMKDNLDENSKKQMEEMIKSGCPLEEVISHFMKKGKTKEQAQADKSEELRQFMETHSDMTQEEVISMLRKELSSEDKAQLEKMLKSGCSEQEVIEHFLNRGKEDNDGVGKTEFQEKMEKMMEGKNLNDDEVLSLLKSQVDEATKAEIQEMLSKGYSKQDVIKHFMKNIKTDEEKMKESAQRLSMLFDDQDMSEEEKIDLLQKQLNEEDKAQMEEMLKNGCSIEEVISHFLSKSNTCKDQETEFALSIQKLSEGKNLTAQEMLELIKENLDDSSKEKLVEMLEKGYTVDDVVNHFMKNGKTPEQKDKEITSKLQVLLKDKNLSEKEKIDILKEHLCKKDIIQMTEMLEKGCSIEEVMKVFLSRSISKETELETELAKTIRKLSDGKQLTDEQVLDLIKEQVDEDSKHQMDLMLEKGYTAQDVINHFLIHGKTEQQQQKETAEMLQNLLNNENLSSEEAMNVLMNKLGDADKAQVEKMLKQGCTLEEVIEHLVQRGNIDETSETELAKKVKKLSAGKSLTDDEILILIKEQLSKDGQEKINEMLQKGYSVKDVINHFLTSGKTEEEEQREIAEKLSTLINKDKMSNEEILSVMMSSLGSNDKALMAEMLQKGCTAEEVIDLFMTRGTLEDSHESELAKKVKKLSQGKSLSKEEMMDIIKDQLSEDSKQKMEDMLQKGYSVQDVINYFLFKGKTLEQEQRDVADKLGQLIDGKSLSDEEILNVMKSELGHHDRAQMEEMLKRGCSKQEVINHFLNRGNGRKEKSEFAKRMESLLEGKNLSPEEIISLMKDNLDDNSKEKINEMLSKGYTVQDVINHMIQTGKSPEEKQKEVAQKMLNLLENNMTEEEIVNVMKKQLGEAGCAEMEQMLKSGYSLHEVIEHFMEKGSTDGRSEETAFSKKINNLIKDKNLTEDQIIDVIRSELDMQSQKHLDQMLMHGCTTEEVINHFMTRDNLRKGQKKNEFGRKIFEQLKGKKLSQKEIVDLIKCNLDPGMVEKMKEMINKCYPMEDIINYFMKYGKTEEQVKKEKAIMKEKARKEVSQKLKSLVGKGSELTNDEIIAIMRLQMGDEDRHQLEKMLKSGCSTEEIIEHFINRNTSDDEGELTQFEKKINELMQGKEFNEDEVLKLMRQELDDESVSKMDEMLKKGYSKDDVIKYFMRHGDDKNDFLQEMKKITEDGNISSEEILNIMKSKLGVLSQRKIDDMLREGHSIQDVINYMMTHGRTQEQETSLFTRRMSQLLEGKDMTEKEKVEKMKDELGKEAASMLEELLKNGYTPEHVLDLFLKHGNDLNSLIKDDFFIRQLVFPDESPDADSHSSRSVFSIIDRNEAKAKIPYMSPSGKNHIFGLFFEKVLELIEGKGLTHREILDLMRSRMGAGYAKEFDELRKKGYSLQQIVDYFLRRDEETLAESRLVARLKADARVDSRVYLKRRYSKEKWGVSLTYSYSKSHGLLLILDQVVENGPAWESGVRPGDVIVTVNDWLIVLMDRPQVAAHLFQAGANIVKLGIQKTRGNSPVNYLGVY